MKRNFVGTSYIPGRHGAPKHASITALSLDIRIYLLVELRTEGEVPDPVGEGRERRAQERDRSPAQADDLGAGRQGMTSRAELGLLSLGEGTWACLGR